MIVFPSELPSPETEGDQDEEYVFEYKGDEDGITLEGRCKAAGDNVNKLFRPLIIS